MKEIDPRVQYAAERTLLAWIRTGLAMMGFGFVVARFSLFLKELAGTNTAKPIDTPGLSLWFGISLIGLGALVSFLSGARYARQIQAMREGKMLFKENWPLERTISIVLALIGVFMVCYLVSLRL